MLSRIVARLAEDALSGISQQLREQLEHSERLFQSAAFDLKQQRGETSDMGLAERSVV